MLMLHIQCNSGQPSHMLRLCTTAKNTLFADLDTYFRTYIANQVNATESHNYCRIFDAPLFSFDSSVGSKIVGSPRRCSLSRILGEFISADSSNWVVLLQVARMVLVPSLGSA